MPPRARSRSSRVSKPAAPARTSTETRQAPAPETVAPQGTADFILGMQMSAGNQAVQRLIQRSGSKLIQRDDVIYMDSSGVGHSEPDKSNAPPILYMDQDGVGHKEPDKSKSHGTIFMDEGGVGHKAPDPTPKRSTPFFMDMGGVAHDAPDDVVAIVQQALSVISSEHSKGLMEAVKIAPAMAAWPARLAQATSMKLAAETAYNEGKALWDVEAVGSGKTAAEKAEIADQHAADAKKAYDDTVAEAPNVKTPLGFLLNAGKAYAKNRRQFKKDKSKWLNIASPMTLDAVNKIQAMLDEQSAAAQAAINLGNTADAEIAKFKAESDAAEDFAKKSWGALARPVSNTYAIVGMMQQKLNATRPDGVERTSIDAYFDTKTETMLKAFQGANGQPPTGKATAATWTQLDTQAPSIEVNGELTVNAKEEAEGSKPSDDTVHPRLKSGASGNAVKELQQRLNNWLAAQPVGPKPPFKALKLDGKFGFKTKNAVKVFQTALNIVPGGEVGKVTWAELDKVAGPVTSGAQSFYSQETVEGMVAGGTSAFDWDFKDDKMIITVKIKFTGFSGHSMVGTWLQDIKDTWNAYKAVEQGVPVPREYNIEFNPVKSSSGVHKVKVRKPTKKDPNPRSDTSNWYVNDMRRGLAPHEFGHLVGLDDEYNRAEEAYVKSTGLEPTVGQTRSGTGASSTAVAADINNVITTGIAAATPGDAILGQVVGRIQHYGLVPGAFSRLVASRYKSAYGFNGREDMARYLASINGDDWTTNLTDATEPFLVTNEGLMGTMQNNMARGTDLNALAPHDHPVQPRHVKSFANLLSMAIPGSVWKPERR